MDRRFRAGARDQRHAAFAFTRRLMPFIHYPVDLAPCDSGSVEAEHDPRTVFTDRPIVQFMSCDSLIPTPVICGRSSRRRFLPPGESSWLPLASYPTFTDGRHVPTHPFPRHNGTHPWHRPYHSQPAERTCWNTRNWPCAPAVCASPPANAHKRMFGGTSVSTFRSSGQRKSFAVPDKSGPEHRSAIYATFPKIPLSYTYRLSAVLGCQRALRVWFFAQHTARDEIHARTIRSDPHHALNFRGAPTWSDRAKPAPAKSRPFPIPHIRAPLQDSRSWPGRD